MTQLFAQALSRADVPVQTTIVDHAPGPGPTAEQGPTPPAGLGPGIDPEFNLVGVDHPESLAAHAKRDAGFFRERYTIGVWTSGTDGAGPGWDQLRGLIDELWVTAAGAHDVLSRASPVPVVSVPLALVDQPSPVSDAATSRSLDAVGEIVRARLACVAATRRDAERAASAPDTGSFVGRAVSMMRWDPVRDAQRVGGVKGRLRLAALRGMRPYTAHQDELNQVLTHALREVAERTEALEQRTAQHQDELNRVLTRALREVTERAEALEQRTAQQPAELRRLADGEGAAALALMIEGMRARPASGHPAISLVDASGQRVLAFSGASSGAATYRGFEDIFRGDERLVRERQESDVRAFEGAPWVLDLGCGRGEFLEALRDHGVRAKGVDLDESMVARCRERGLDVDRADAASYLAGLDDDSVPGVYAAQVVEHLAAEQLTALIELLRRKLAPGGRVILETVNGHNPAALKAFWTDATHHHPLYPEVLLALCRLGGFESGEVRFRENTGDFNADVYANRDYAVHAWKGAAPTRSA